MSFEILYAKSVYKDIKKLDTKTKNKIKNAVEKLRNFPNITNIKSLRSHPLADYRLRVGDYRVLFDVDWENKKIYIY
ncbi:type II toxin-antitoxin system RelE/ParE family toxin [Persephonella atlantica]|uniref:Type II toxin-antitoxin system RelE/ParE family toxin n=1 Tax=Persephonella atlantica TaxID=2699429 RepID=A0ABS1GJ36_9AQUI|nr:type II toxin-antitoxin system RelE/ParE family toxin [Persephonella atlantica]